LIHSDAVGVEPIGIQQQLDLTAPVAGNPMLATHPLFPEPV
jgi:hypothetical protein